MSQTQLLLCATVGLPLALLLACCWRPLREGMLPWLAVAPLPGLLTAFFAAHGELLMLGNERLPLALEIDRAGGLLLGVAALLWMAGGWYAANYLRGKSWRGHFIVCWLMTLTGCLGVFVAADMAGLYAMLALLSVGTTGLVLCEGSPRAYRAGAIYIGMALFAESLVLVGMILVAGLIPLIPIWLIHDQPWSIAPDGEERRLRRVRDEAGRPRGRPVRGVGPPGGAGGEGHEGEGSVRAIVKNGQEVPQATAGETVELVLDRTPFYGESGGQMGDTGRVQAPTGAARVIDTLKPAPALVVHKIEVSGGEILADQEVELFVEEGERVATARNHSSTHLLHAALRRVLGEHVKQAGSLVGPSRLRFDFTHIAPMTPAEITRDPLVRKAYLGAESKLRC